MFLVLNFKKNIWSVLALSNWAFRESPHATKEFCFDASNMKYRPLREASPLAFYFSNLSLSFAVKSMLEPRL